MSALGPGALVRCVVDASLWFTTNGEAVPVKGVVYTVRTVETTSEGPFIRLSEIVNPVDQYSDGHTEAQFDACGFVPVGDTALDVFRRTCADLPNETVPA